MADLFESSDSDTGNVGELKLNEDYAKNYNRWREKEELQKLKDKYGENATLDSSSSSSESEDEDAEELTPALEKKFLETLSALKSKDPKIYDKDTVFFEPTGESSVQRKEKKKKDKPMFLKDYERKLIVEKQGVLSDDEDNVTGPAQHKQGQYATAAEEEQLKRSFKAALADSDEEQEENGDGGSLLKMAKQSKDGQDAADEEYKLWLKGEVDKIQHSKDAKKLGYLRSYWNSSSLEKSEEFLRDYILNKRYLEKNQLAIDQIDDQEDLSADEATLEEQEVFEHKFNYRFEEPDSEFIKKYPRTMQDSMRRTDDRRKVKRQEVRERKLQEKEQKREEINRLKALKKKDILEKLERLKEVTGNEQVGFADADIEGDFDPEEYDRRMNGIFNNEYYDQEAEEVKPEDPVDEELGLEDWDQWQGGEEEEEGAEGNGEGEQGWTENGDDSYAEGLGEACDDEDESEWTSEMKGKRRKKSHFAKVVSKRKPVFDPSSKSFEEYFDEYYKLDFEDIVGGMPTRFRYRSVVPNDFGLTVEEILSAKDKELNRWCSVKKTCQYRTENEEMQDYHTFQGRASNLYLKRKIFPSLYAEEVTETNEGTPSDEQEGRKKRRRKKKKPVMVSESVSETEPLNSSVLNVPTSSKKKRKRKASTGDASRSDVELQSGTTTVASGASEHPKELDARGKKYALSSSTQSANPGSSAMLSQGSLRLEKSSTGGRLNKGGEDTQATATSELSGNRKKWKRKVKSTQSSGPTNKQSSLAPAFKVSANRLKAYGLNPKKVQKQLIYGKKKSAS